MNSQELGRQVVKRRKDKGLSQEALAERAGVSRPWVVEVEQGKARAELGLVLRLMRVLGLLIDVYPMPSESEIAARAAARQVQRLGD